MYGYYNPRRNRGPKNKAARTLYGATDATEAETPHQAVSLCFRAKCSFEFLVETPGFGPGQFVTAPMPQAVTLCIWDTAQHPLYKFSVNNKEYTAIEVPWHSAGHEPPHSKVVKISAYVKKMQCHVANVCIPLLELRKKVEEGGTVVLQHAFNERCRIALHVAMAEGKPTSLDDFKAADHQSKDMALTAANLHRASDITNRMCESIVTRLKKIYDRLGPSFLPRSMGADKFTNLATMLPVTMGDQRLAIHMTQLQHTLNKRGGAVSLQALVYFLHAASLVEGVEAEKDIEHFKRNPRLTFRVFRRTQTLFTIDGGADKYTSDVAPVGVQEVANIDNTVSNGLKMEDTENMQTPWSQIAMRGDDCEDYAMAILLIALSLEFHADEAERIARGEAEAIRECFERTPLDELSEECLLSLLLRVHHFGQKIRSGELETCLACVAAGAPSLEQGAVDWQNIGGHECCFSKMQEISTNEQTGVEEKRVIDATVLEGTNIANNTIHYTEAQCKKLSTEMLMWFQAQQKRLEKKKADNQTISEEELLQGFRPELVQHIGATGDRYSSTFYRCFFAIDSRLIMTRDAEVAECDGDEIQLRAHIDDIIMTLMQNKRTVKFIELKGSGVVDPKDFAWYQDFATDVGLEAQAPSMTQDQWKEAMFRNIRPEDDLTGSMQSGDGPEQAAAYKGWARLPAKPPTAFQTARDYVDALERNDTAHGRMVTLYSTKNKRAESLPFMNVHISVFTCPP